MANIFAKLFKQKREPTVSEAGLLTSGAAVFTPFSGNAYASDIYRAAVDAIARNAAKLKGTHIIHGDTVRGDGDGVLNRMLQVRPNPYISAFDMIYRLVTHYYLYNNAFALLTKDDRGNLAGIYPLQPNNIEFMTDINETLYARFSFDNGNQYIFPYTNVVHLRRNYNTNDLLGDQNTALLPALELAHTQNEGIINAIKTGANIRGILKFTQIMAPDVKKSEKEQFIKDYMQMDNNGGVIVTDGKMEYEPIESKPYAIDEKQLQAAKAKIYEYLGISEKIVNSTYTEDEWAAFYESVIEPIAVQLSLEFTAKIFTPREQAFGNSILFEANRLQYSSVATKTQLIRELVPLKLLTINQALDILNLPSVEDGDQYIQSLNYVNARIADKYQLGARDDERNPNM